MSIFLLLLLVLLFIFVTPALNSKQVTASKVSIEWGCIMPAPGGQAPAGESGNESWICDQIYQMFRDYSSFGYTNAYGVYTTANYVQQILQYCQHPDNNVNWATAWWVGDFVPNLNGGYPPVNRGFYGYNGNNICDSEIYAYANYVYLGWPPSLEYIPSKQYFSFMWTCANGGLYFDSNGNTWNVSGITYPYASQSEPVTPPINPFTYYGALLQDGFIDTIGGMP